MRLHLQFACAQLLLLTLVVANGEGSGHKAPEHARLSQAHFIEVLAHEQPTSRLLAAAFDSDELPQQRPRPLCVSVEQQHLEELNSPQQSLLSSAANATVELLKTHFQVRRPPLDGLLGYPPCSEEEDSGSISKPTNCTAYNAQPKCGKAIIKPSHLADPSTCETSSSGSLQCRSYTGGRGEDTDLYLYLTSVQEETCNGGAVAWALPCILDISTNRPVIATVNICPGSLGSSSEDGNEDSTPDEVIALMVHEVIHALGFSNSMFSLFVDPDMLEERGVANVTKKVDVGGREVTAIVTPTVRREARQQFGCAQLEGANLEDEGGSGSANAHWEWTEYQGDLMLAQRSVASGDPPVISRLTMALLEDTGWYLANWTAAGGPLPFAHNTGCTLPLHGCQAMLDQQQQNPDISGGGSSSSSSFLFCSPNPDSAQRTRCTTSLRALGEQCKTDQTFSNGCGMVVAEAPSCTLPDKQYPNPLAFGWKHTPQSRCFDVMLEFQATSSREQSLETLTFPEGGKQGGTASGASAACFPSRCNEAGHHFVIVLGRELRCPTGAMLNLAQLVPDIYQEGSIGPCPNEAEACQKTLSCGSCSRLGGVCSFGSCRCKLGWQGADCSHSLMGVVSLSDQQPLVEGTWFEVLEVSLRLGTKGRKQSDREQGKALREVFTEWSGQPKQSVRVAKLDQHSQSTSQAPASERGLRERPQHQQMKQHAQHSRRMQALRLSLGTALGRTGGRGLLHDLEAQEQASSQSEEVKEVTELQVTFHTRPTPEEQINLSGRLASTGAVQQLSEMLEGAGFELAEDSISQRLAVLMHKDIELEADEGGNAEQDGFGAAEKIITGCVVGVGGLLLLLLIPLGLLWWARSGGCCLHPHLADTTAKDRDTSKHSLHDDFDDEKEGPQPRSASVPFMGSTPKGRFLYNPLNRRWFSEYQIPDDKDPARPPLPIRPSGISVALPSSPSSASHAATIFEHPSNACTSLITPHAPPQALGPRYSDARASAITCSSQGQLLPPPPLFHTARDDQRDPSLDLPSISPVGSPQGSFTCEAPLPVVPPSHASSGGEEQPWQMQHRMLATWIGKRATDPYASDLGQAGTPSRGPPSRPRMTTMPHLPAATESAGEAPPQPQGTPTRSRQAQHSTANNNTAAVHSPALSCPARPSQEAAPPQPPQAQHPASCASPAKETGSFVFSYTPARRPRAGHRWASSNQVTPLHGSVASQSRLQASTPLPSSAGGVQQGVPVSPPLSPPQNARARASAPQVLDDDDDDDDRGSSAFQFSYTPSPRRRAGQSSFLKRTLTALSPSARRVTPRASEVQRTLGSVSPSPARRTTPRASEVQRALGAQSQSPARRAFEAVGALLPSPAGRPPQRASEAQVGARSAATPQPEGASAYQFSYGGGFLASIFSTPGKARHTRKSAPVIGRVPDDDNDEHDNEVGVSRQREVKEAW